MDISGEDGLDRRLCGGDVMDCNADFNRLTPLTLFYELTIVMFRRSRTDVIPDNEMETFIS